MTIAQYDLNANANGTVTSKGISELPNLIKKSGLKFSSLRNLAIDILEKEVHNTVSAAIANPL